MHRLRRAFIAALFIATAGTWIAADSGTIEEIRVQGLFRMTQEAFLHALGIQTGDPYDPVKVQGRFKELWKLQLFDDITIEVETSPQGGKVLVVKVKERPVLTAVDYEDNKAVTRTQIEDRLKERQIKLELGKPLDMRAVFDAESAIRDMLGEKGYLDAEVDSEVREVTSSTRAVHVSITTGGKTRIRKIDFTGNTVFSDKKLRKQLKLTQAYRWYWPLSGKNLYHPLKWDQDVGGVRNLYQNNGYLDVVIRPPVVDLREEHPKKKHGDLPAPPPETPAPPAPTPPAPAATVSPKQLEREERQRTKEQKKARAAEQKAKKVKRWVYLSVAVREGEQYRVGQVTLQGNKVVADNLIHAAIPLRQGDVFNNAVLDHGVELITALYENTGRLYASVVREIHRHESERVADVEIRIDEDEPYYVAHIDFKGNDATQDRVLRREFLLAEGELFSRAKLDLSRRKVNQLGYFQIANEPAIEPIEGEKRVNVTLSGEEQGRNEIQVGGGYSGLDGAFFNGVYSTRNFLGRGQVMSVALQVGGRANRYQLSFQEPWFLGRPILFGASLFRTDVNYGSTLRSTSSGVGLQLGKRVWRFAEVGAGYRFQDVTSTTLLLAAGTATGNRQVEATNRISSITPLFRINTVNNPQRPNRGLELELSAQVAGGPLGGDTSFLKPAASFTVYRRLFGRNYLASHMQVGYVKEWAEGSDPSTSNINGVPRFERFWLGGETLGPRVFETRTITPLRYVEVQNNQVVRILGDPRFISPSDLVTSGGVPALVEVGGNRFYLFQNEFVLPLADQAELAFFVDAGDSLFDDTDFSFDTLRASAGIEVRFYLPIFPVPLRLIYGVPLRKLEHDRTSSFTFSIGRSF
ncbi:MAG TPA: outer membrane protein assembly factor BamA [Candidatus Polarisedimenticolaceae bacterium]|nr:outer membrane protein assembly factor BamA [Candidatus Polarisedimenticolaceae bacterium]